MSVNTEKVKSLKSCGQRMAQLQLVAQLRLDVSGRLVWGALCTGMS